MYNISNEELVKNTFYITYAFLMTTATITFIEAMRTKDPKVRNILNLETCNLKIIGKTSLAILLNNLMIFFFIIAL